jgi:hypothetical protein
MAGTLALVVLGAGALVFWYRATYNVLPGQGASSRVHWCGRDYEAATPATDTWSRSTARAPGKVRLVGRYPPLGARDGLYAALSPAAARGTSDPPLPCAMVVYLRTAPDRYRTYVLEGGP